VEEERTGLYDIFESNYVSDRRKQPLIFVNRRLMEFRLSANALAVYIAILSHADRKTARSFPSQDRLGEMVRLSAPTVRIAIRELVERGLLRMERRVKPSGGNTSCLYEILDHPDF